MTVESLRAEGSAGVLLSGEFGVGKSVMVRNLLASADLIMPPIRLICSAALTESPYGALAPLLTGVTEPVNDVIAIREALAVVGGQLAESETAGQVLILVEEAQFIDSASAFVLGQLVRSGSVKLLVLSNEEHHDPLSLEALMSVARLTRIRVDTLTVDEVADYCRSYLGGRLSRGSAMIIHQATAGFHLLVHGFLELAKRQDALVQTHGFWVLKQQKLHCDEHASEVVKELLYRQNPGLRSVMELLSLCGPLSLMQLKTLDMLEPLHHHQTALVRIRNGKAWIASSFYAQGIRQGMLPGHNLALFEHFVSVLGEQLPANLELARWAVGLGQQLPDELLQQILDTGIRTHEHALVMELVEQRDESESQRWGTYRIRALLGLGHFHMAVAVPLPASPGTKACPGDLSTNLDCVVRWNQKGLGGQAASFPVAVQVGNDQPQWSNEVADPVEGPWQDCRILALVERAREAYRAGRVSEALELADHHVDGDCVVAPACHYRLSLLVVLVHSLLASGNYRDARAAVENFTLHDGYEIVRCHGSIQFLRALVMAHEGKVNEARRLLVDAAAELSLHDPEGLTAPCSALTAVVLTQQPDQRSNGIPAKSEAQWLQPKGTGARMLPYGAQLWWLEGQLEARLLGELKSEKPSSGTIGRLLDQASHFGILLQDALHYHVWTYSNDELLRTRSARFYEELVVPPGCRLLEIHQKVAHCVASGEVTLMEEYATELHQSGEKVTALELCARIVEYWSAHNNPRSRGFAIRRIHEWLHDLGQEPWGIMAQVLGASGLTAREEEIVDLVRQGLSNREIARLLTVSQRTVEGHLYRIFAKLGITQRSELSFGE
ncbi:LuxR C-terminal-related transcriptional regulator [Glutamicibacter sp. MNS18]|uniref:response regulator transcription factor n=1 Tax=Glutamicibacter sp. MNS18 TaxID=2989817 RepID=UPI00223623E1|nr:LuxR family transcriptional regulator [Glutamicibacter sp. MNS18]MCW4466144.1 LuxR C-terminal-related transcriptional regulator [Glutamicibacter sp. MNS18]